MFLWKSICLKEHKNALWTCHLFAHNNFQTRVTQKTCTAHFDSTLSTFYVTAYMYGGLYMTYYDTFYDTQYFIENPRPTSANIKITAILGSIKTCQSYNKFRICLNETPVWIKPLFLIHTTLRLSFVWWRRRKTFGILHHVQILN